MELKYYLRGLGLGIVVTAIIMGVAGSGKKTMTDAEVITRAKQLGMIEGTVLSENAGEKDDTPDDEKDTDDEEPDADADKRDTEGRIEEPKQDDTAKQDTDIANEGEPDNVIASGNNVTGPEDDIEPEKDEEADMAGALEPENQEQEAAASQPEREPGKLPGSDSPMVITIGSGDGSYAVSKKLADIGAIVSPENFDTFLCQNGYDKKIRTGTYTIPADASDEQMARIITGAE